MALRRKGIRQSLVWGACVTGALSALYLVYVIVAMIFGAGSDDGLNVPAFFANIFPFIFFGLLTVAIVEIIGFVRHIVDLLERIAANSQK